MRVQAGSDMHRQLLQIPDCACSSASPIDSRSPPSKSPPTPGGLVSSAATHTYERFWPAPRDSVRSL
jgi:hypothetical protein